VDHDPLLRDNAGTVARPLGFQKPCRFESFGMTDTLAFMTTYYRNRETDKIQSHPQSGLGESLNADEIGEDGKAVKPRTSLAPSKGELKAASDLLKDHSGTPNTTGGKSVAGETNKQEGAK
jgi:hypothetical protein